MTDLDPSIRLTLHKDGEWITFDIALSPTFGGFWGVIETGTYPHVQLVNGTAAACAARESIDRKVRALLEEGWLLV